MSRSIRAVTALTLVGLFLAACNTVAGVGRDIEAGGEAITGTANDAAQ